MRHFGILAILLSSILISACSSSTKLRDSWSAESFNADDFNQVLVVGNTSNTSTRLILEAAFTRELKRLGIDATQSNHVMGNGKLSKEKVLAYLADNPYKYVLSTRVQDIKESNNYVQPTATVYSTGGYYYPGYYGHSGIWNGNSTLITTEGYMDTYETLIMETTIFDGSSKELVWAAQIESFEPSSVSDVAETVADLTVKHLHDK